MRAGRLVTDKGTEIHSVRPDVSLTTAANLMRSHQIGSLLVTGDHRQPLGLITERDIVVAFATHRSDAVHLSVQTVMQQEIPSCDVTDTLEHVMATMTNRRTRHVLVYDTDTLIGILSIGDIIKRRLTELEDENRLVHKYLSSGVHPWE